MNRLISALVLAFATFVAHAAVDANKASQAELEAIKGIGPGMATRILDARKKGTFNNWADMIERVRGLGQGNAAKLSEAGLRVGSASFARPGASAQATPAAAKPTTPAAAVAPAPAATRR